MTALTDQQQLNLTICALMKIKSFTDINMRYRSEDPLFDAIERINIYCGRVLARVDSHDGQ
jgi:hypothetical protein